LLSRDAQLLIGSRIDVCGRAERALRPLFEEILGVGPQSVEIRVDLRIEAVADVLTKRTFSYANRQFVTGQAILTELGRGASPWSSGVSPAPPVRPA